MNDNGKPSFSISTARRAWNIAVKAGAVLISAAVVLIYSSKAMTAALLAATAAGVILFCLPQTVPFSLLLLSSYLERTQWEVGFTLKLEHVFIIFLILIVFLRPTGRPWKKTPPTHYPILAYLAANLFSTLMFSIEPGYGFKQCVLITLVTLSYFVVSGFCLRNPGRMKSMFHLYLVMGVLHSIYGVVSFALLRVGINTGGAYLTGFGDYYVRGAMYEGNLFGGLTAMHALMLFNMAQDNSLPASTRRWLWPATSIHVLALIFSNTRTAVAGFLIGVAISIAITRGGRVTARLRLYSRAIAVICAGVVIFAAIVWASGIISPTGYVSRIINVLDPGEVPESLTIRLESFERALEYWRLSPIFGHGTGSFKSFQRSKPSYEQTWLGNQFILALQDTGIAGAAMLLWLIGATFIPYFAVYRKWRAGPDLCYLRGFFTSLICIWICFQMTTGLWMSYFWVWLGFAAAFLEVGRNNCERVNSQHQIPENNRDSGAKSPES